MFIALTTLMLATTPPVALPSESGQNADFAVIQLAVPDVDGLIKQWAVPGAGVEITTTNRLVRDKATFTAIVFKGCMTDPKGDCHVTARYQITDPDGQPYEGKANDPPRPVYDGKPVAAPNLQLGGAFFGLRIEHGEALGAYLVRIETTDVVSHRTIITQSVLTAVEAE